MHVLDSSLIKDQSKLKEKCFSVYIFFKKNEMNYLVKYEFLLYPIPIDSWVLLLIIKFHIQNVGENIHIYQIIH